MKNDRTAKNKAIKKSQLQVTDLEATDSESRYKLLADHMVDHVFILDLEGNTKFVSPFAKTLLGYSDEEADNWVVGQNITPASLEVGAEVFQEIFACAKRGKKDLYKSWTLQTEVMRKDGSTVWASRSAYLV
jgi:PAS domain S-box-containing protein